MKTETLELNGQPFSYAAAADLAPLLSEHFHCIAPNQRGHVQRRAIGCLTNGLQNTKPAEYKTEWALVGPITGFATKSRRTWPMPF
ncbi:MAG: hypothetical protein KUG62_03375 [Rhodobacteraceae bacterium]|nr:hypothetical protein [Paracoccaceae bacterium]